MATTTHRLRPVEQAHNLLGLTYAEIARAIGADESTLPRWRTGDTEPSPLFLARLDALGEFLTELQWIAKGAAAARSWLDCTVPALEGMTPRAVLLDGRIERLASMLYDVNAGNAL